MRYRLDIPRDDATATVTVSGHVTLAGLVALVMLALDHRQWRRGMNLLVELRGVQFADADPGSQGPAKNGPRLRPGCFGEGRLALVVPTDAEHQVGSRLMQACVGSVRHMVTFRSRKNAADWLRAGPGPTKCNTGSDAPGKAATGR